MGKKIVISDELLQEIAGSLPFCKDASCKYTPSMYKKHKFIYDKDTKEFKDSQVMLIPEELHPTFLLRRMTESEYQLAERILTEIVEKNDKESAKQRQIEITEIVRHCIIGWYNFIDIGKKEEIDYIKDEDGAVDFSVWNIFGKHDNNSVLLNNDCINDIFTAICKLSCLQQPDIFSLK